MLLCSDTATTMEEAGFIKGRTLLLSKNAIFVSNTVSYFFCIYNKNPTSEMVKKSINKSSSTKRPRDENPPPLPAFKVRKEKMGDRITALQQLVSPFGKTDPASMLSEAIEYIKFLHEQVNDVPDVEGDKINGINSFTS